MSDSSNPSLKKDGDAAKMESLVKSTENMNFGDKVPEYSLTGDQLNLYNSLIKPIQNHEKTPFFNFVQGQAGTGKTVLLEAIERTARELLGQDAVLTTATTAIAANMIGAASVHSTFLIRPLPNDPFIFPQSRLKRLYAKLRKVKVLLLDGVQYLGAEPLIKINEVLQTARNDRGPFGGISVIFFGDLYQMYPHEHGIIYQNPRSRELWQLLRLHELTENKKMDHNEDFDRLSILKSNQSEEVRNYLRDQCHMEDGSLEGVIAKQRELIRENPGKLFTIIVPTGPMVGEINDAILLQNNNRRRFAPENSIDNIIGRENDYFYAGDKDEKNFTAVDGSQVVLTQNVHNLLHGAFGVVVGFDDDSVNVRFGENVTRIERIGWYCDEEGWEQFPLRMANAFTVQRAQGMSFDGVIIVKKWKWNEADGQRMNPGQFYTCISRAKSLKLCRITPIEPLNWQVQRGAGAELDRMRAANAV